MNSPVILLIGLSGMIAQIIILRGFLVSFLGNELTIGIILANWILLEALGVFITAKIIDNFKSRVNLFIILEIIFCLSLVSSVYLAGVLKFAFNILPPEGISLALVFLSSFLIILPLSFSHGALFSVVCSFTDVGKAYAWEIAGSILGGLSLAYLLLPRLDSFQIVGIVILINLIIVFVFIGKIRRIGDTPLRGLSPILIGTALLFIIFSQPALNYLKRDSLKKSWPGLNVLESADSLYGNIAVTEKLKQYTFFYNGIPLITTPFPDRQFVEELGNLPLLFHPAPREMLIAGAGAGGLINEALRHNLNSLDYVEVDPLIISMLKKYPTDLTKRELNDARVKIINTDPRLFLNNGSRLGKALYDVILIGLSNQSDLSTNRLFTEEFFILAKKKMNAQGVIALWLPGSLTYLSYDLKGLNKSVLNALKNAYKFVRVIPGDYNIYLASDSSGIMAVTPEVITQRIGERKLAQGIFILDYLKYRLAFSRQDWLIKELAVASNQVNRDLRPIAVFDSLLLWNKKFSPQAYGVLSIFKALNLRIIFGVLILIAGLIFITLRSQKAALGYSIFTTGFFGMLASLLLIFSYQVFYGYLYQKVSILIALFMAGITLGSGLITSFLSKIKEGRSLFFKLEAAITLFILGLGLIIARFNHSALTIYALLFISGLIVGLEFPLANKIYSLGKEDKVSSVGMLYAADLMGGWLAGLFAGIIFLPILGFFNSCLVMLIMKLSSLCCFGSVFHLTRREN